MKKSKKLKKSSDSKIPLTYFAYSTVDLETVAMYNYFYLSGIKMDQILIKRIN